MWIVSVVYITSDYILPSSGELNDSWHNKGLAPDIKSGVAPTAFDDDPQLADVIEFLETGAVTSVVSTLESQGAEKRPLKQGDPWVKEMLKRKQQFDF